MRNLNKKEIEELRNINFELEIGNKFKLSPNQEFGEWSYLSGYFKIKNDLLLEIIKVNNKSFLVKCSFKPIGLKERRTLFTRRVKKYNFYREIKKYSKSYKMIERDLRLGKLLNNKK